MKTFRTRQEVGGHPITVALSVLWRALSLRSCRQIRPARSLGFLVPLGTAFGVPLASQAENHLDYRYEYYGEENNRMKILTSSAYFTQAIADRLAINGEFVYDSISGATPLGTHDLAGKAVTTHLKDTRYAGNVTVEDKWSNHTLAPGFACSQESDYTSIGISLNDDIEFNEKNTTVRLGASHNFDRVRHADKKTWSDKNSTEGIIGVSQLLGPATVFDAAFTLGNDSGFLNDPYRMAQYFPSFLPFAIGIPEKRPSHRTKEILYTALIHHFKTLDASLEGSYRFYHDSFGVDAHTTELRWHQWAGKHVIVEPFGRFYYQTAASFYSPQFVDPLPAFYSSDYRLSELYTFDLGCQVTVVVTDHVRAVGGYHRYEMHGLDNTTSDMYPKANVFTCGITVLW